MYERPLHVLVVDGQLLTLEKIPALASLSLRAQNSFISIPVGMFRRSVSFCLFSNSNRLSCSALSASKLNALLIFLIYFVK